MAAHGMQLELADAALRVANSNPSMPMDSFGLRSSCNFKIIKIICLINVIIGTF